MATATGGNLGFGRGPRTPTPMPSRGGSESANCVSSAFRSSRILETSIWSPSLALHLLSDHATGQAGRPVLPRRLWYSVRRTIASQFASQLLRQVGNCLSPLGRAMLRAPGVGDRPMTRYTSIEAGAAGQPTLLGRGTSKTAGAGVEDGGVPDPGGFPDPRTFLDRRDLPQRFGTFSSVSQLGGLPGPRLRPRAIRSSLSMASSICARSASSSARILETSMRVPHLRCVFSASRVANFATLMIPRS
jgi:hypothetical protein